MGRKLYRVPLDFNWPMKTTWGGFVNPFRSQSVKCTACGGSGLSAAMNRYESEWHGSTRFDPIAYGSKPIPKDHPAIDAIACCNIDFDPLADRTLPEFPQLEFEAEMRRLYRDCFGNRWNYHLNQADVDAILKEEEITGRQMLPGINRDERPTADSVNDYLMRNSRAAHVAATVMSARLEREGAPHDCDVCDLDGRIWPSDGVLELYENWKEAPPPVGEGYQLWETTSEGSPISPVFPTIDELCSYAELHCTTFGSFTATAREWRDMLDRDYVIHQEGNVTFI